MRFFSLSVCLFLSFIVGVRRWDWEACGVFLERKTVLTILIFCRDTWVKFCKVLQSAGEGGFCVKSPALELWKLWEKKPDGCSASRPSLLLSHLWQLGADEGALALPWLLLEGFDLLLGVFNSPLPSFHLVLTQGTSSKLITLPQAYKNGGL